MFLSSMIESVARLFAPAHALESDCIDHPLLQGMSLRELADLPFPRPLAPELQTPEFEADLPLADLPQTTAIAPAEPHPPAPEALPHAA